MRLAVELTVVLLLLLLNAFLAASEIALVSARKSRLRALADNGDQRAERVLVLAESPGQFLATIQIGITLAGFFASAVGAVSLASTVQGWLEAIDLGLIADNAALIAIVIVTIVISLFSIIIGELVPKTLAVSRAESVSLAVVRPIELLSRATKPLVSLLTGITNIFLRAAGEKGRASMPSVTQAEILAMLEVAQDEGLVHAEEADLVEGALGFGDIHVRNVMVPRVDVEAVEGGTTLGAAVELFFSTGFSRLPVFRDTPDDVLGILYVKDVFRLTWTDRESGTKPASEFVRPAYFVPETKPIDELLQELRAQRTHLAVVVDEYGGMAGIVTLEDLLEELVGEISDEFDPGYEPFREIEPGVYDVDARVSIMDLLDMLDLDRDEIEPFDVESVGGLIADRMGRLPEVGDIAEAGPLRFEVRSMDGYRVALARVSPHLLTPEPSAPADLPDPEDDLGSPPRTSS